MTIVLMVVMTLILGGITFGVLSTFWGKGLIEFALFVGVSWFAIEAARLAWGSVL